VRTALGAQRTRIVRQLLTESVVLALAGGLLGLLFAQFGVQALGALNSANLAGEPIDLDGTVLAFALALSVVTGLVFGLAPAIQLARGSVQSALRDGGRGAAGSRNAQRLRRILIVSEVALAVMLLAGAGLMIRSFARLADSSPGFDPRRVLTFTVALPEAKYQTDEQRLAFFDRLLSMLASAPGFRAVGATTHIPMGQGVGTRSFTIEGYETGPDRPRPWGDFRGVSPALFETLRTPVLRGRSFTELDGPGAPNVVLVDEELARRYWPTEDPIGKRITFARPTGDSIPWREVVGVVGHVKNDPVDGDARVQLYVPYRQMPRAAMAVAVRTSGDPLAAVPQVRDLVRSLDREQPISMIKTMDDLVNDSMGQRRVSTMLLTVFAGFALLIACIGLYGITAYAVTQRTREIGVRMALGAVTSQVVRPFVRDSLTLAVLGLVLGTAGALAASRLLASQLYGVAATDPLTLGSTAFLLAAVAALASWLPARRATRVDPIIALRSE
jgi:putative ABC transport system permease protein